uniref:Transmembrane protein putative n=1 Tax=Albugo laibachii Nc14 TaxID=890382 RepID=F0WN15_9STRA|nr:transmembrane protein putative [Albugo laibachii Nc14]|eukprot:CCA22702.1 transmembrane protein putative [Albugo laibachii Nc14]
MIWCQRLAPILLLNSLASATDSNEECVKEWDIEDIMHINPPICKAASFVQPQHEIMFRSFYFDTPKFNLSNHMPDYLSDINWEALWTAFHHAVVGSMDCIMLWIRFYHLAFIPLLRTISVMTDTLLPHALSIAQALGQMLLRLEWYYQVLIGMTILFAVVIVRKGYVQAAKARYDVFISAFRQRYRAFLTSLSAKSRLAMLSIPHLLYFGAACGLPIYAPKFILTTMLSSDLMTNMLLVILPLIRSICVLRNYRNKSTKGSSASADPVQRMTRSSVRKGQSFKNNELCALEYELRFWIVWSLGFCVKSITSLFIPSFIVAYIKPSNYWSNFILLWLQIPVMRGSSMLYYLISRFYQPRTTTQWIDFGQVDATNLQPESTDRNLVIRTLMALSIISERHISILQDVWSQGPALCGLIFLFTPGFITSRGCYIIGFGFPAHSVIVTLHRRCQTKRYEWWLCYYIVLAGVEYTYYAVEQAFSWVPLFFHVKLLTLLWLQFPYFQGAQRLLDRFYANVFIRKGGV